MMFILPQPIKEWLWRVAMQKGLKRAAQLGATLALHLSAKWGLEGFGVKIDGQALEAGLLMLLGGGLEVLRNWLKHRLGGKLAEML